MKTSKLLIFGTITSYLFLGIFACADKFYRIDTQINSNGSGVKTIYAQSDSAFLFSYSSDWKLKKTDSIKAAFFYDIVYNVFINKPFRYINESSEGLSYPEEIRPLIAPKEQLKKHFRWFYTYYSFETVYSHLQVPVSIDKYMNKEEQKCWFQGDFSIFRGKSGFESKEELDDLESRFFKWYAQNVYEVSFNTIHHFAGRVAGNPYFSELETVKDTIFALNFKDYENNDFKQIPPERICNMLDAYFHTEIFSTLFSENKDSINLNFEEQLYALEKAPNQFFLEYNLIIPGKIFLTNSDLNLNDTLIWRINALRLYASEDYILRAESRKTNIWAFIVTFLFGIGALLFFLKQKRL